MLDLKALQQKAAVLIEALPYIQNFAGETFVVKYGGHAMTNPEARVSFARDVVLLRSIGIKVVVVHGGGPQIKAMLDRLGVVSEFKGGMRVTDDATMEVVRMVLVGQVNQDIVALLNSAGGRAVGLSGTDANLLQARRIQVDGEDVGRVGAIHKVDDDEVGLLTQGGFIPVIAPVAVDGDGGALNINADLAAGAIATHLNARKFILMTDVAGVADGTGEVLRTIDRSLARRLVADGVIAGGMIPKLRAGLDALDAGVRKVHVVDGRVRHALLLELFTDRGVGTEVV
jgi:acetylglutamate kinase